MLSQPKSVKFEINPGQEIFIETGKLARQSDGAVTIRQGNCILLATVVANKDPKDGQDFFPLSVDYQEFVSICSHIKKEIRSQQITGGMLGMFNPSITQRLNNLVEKTDNKTDTTFRLVDDTTGNANQSSDPA